MPTRRHVLALGGGSFATLFAPRLGWAAAAEVIEMQGTARGERVWFAPRGLAVAPGTTLRFVNRDPGNSLGEVVHAALELVAAVSMADGQRGREHAEEAIALRHLAQAISDQRRCDRDHAVLRIESHAYLLCEEECRPEGRH